MKRVLICAAAVLAALCALKVNANTTINWSASGSTVLTHPGGTTGLAQGSYLRLGYLSPGTTEAILQANRDNVAFVASNLWGGVTPAAIGDGTGQDGTFAVSWTGSSFAMLSRHMYLLALNAPTIEEASEIGLFTNPNWITPAHINDPPMNLDLADSGLQVIIGDFSAGTVTTPTDLLGGNAAQLYAIPEPTTVVLTGLAVSACVLMLRRYQAPPDTD